MLENVSMQTLLKYAAFGGLITAVTGYAVRGRIHNNIKNTAHFKKALEELKAHRGAIYILGEPIQVGNVNIDDSANNFTKDYTAQYRVPVIGLKKEGDLYFWAERDNVEDEWIICRMELGLKDTPNKRLLVKSL